MIRSLLLAGAACAALSTAASAQTVAIVNARIEPVSGATGGFIKVVAMAAHKPTDQDFTAPITKPWGQTVAYVRAPEGTLIELCTPMG